MAAAPGQRRRTVRSTGRQRRRSVFRRAQQVFASGGASHCQRTSGAAEARKGAASTLAGDGLQVEQQRRY